MDSYFGCLRWISQSVQVLLNGIESVMELALIILKQRTLGLGQHLPSTVGASV